MARMVKRKCKNCGIEFEARAADVKRGWGNFHNKSCKAIYQERLTGQYASLSQTEDDNDYGHLFASGYGGHGQL